MNDDFSEERIARELTSGEKLLWSGRPRQGLVLRPTDTLVIPFSLLWCGFAVFWEASALRLDAPWFFKLWGIPFVLVGLYMIFGRFIVDVYERSRTRYGVTSSRVILISGLLHESVRSLPLRNLSEISLSERSDGTGNVVFGNAYGPGQFMNLGSGGSQWYQPATFECIPDARAVHDLIRREIGKAE
ncbi:MAG: PH domain-containing protein [Isosphaerales bacterium]